MQRELYEVEKDRFDLKDSSLYHLQGTWPKKDHKPEAVLDGEKASGSHQCPGACQRPGAL